MAIRTRASLALDGRGIKRLGWLVLIVPLVPLGCRRSATVPSTGVVRSSAGDAIAGARVCAWPMSIDRRGIGWQPTCTVADDEGRYRLELREKTVVHVIADAEGFLSGRHRAHPSPSLPWLTVSEGAPLTGVDITLEPGGQRHQGRLVDHQGDAIADGMVVLSILGEDRLELTTLASTDANGRYDAWGHADVSATPVTEGRVLHDAIERETPAGLELVAIPESRILGQVVTQSGAPAPGARVTVTEMARPFGHPHVATTTDMQGHFELRGLAPGEHQVMAHTGQGGGTSTAILLGLGEASEPITVRLTRPLAPLHAQVVDAATGEGVPYCMVGLRVSDEPERRLPSWFRTDGRGRLELELAPGPRTIDGLSCPGHAARPPYPVIEVGQDDAELRWEVDRGITFRGRLVDAHERPVGAQWVSSFADDPALRELHFFIGDGRVQTASDGTFALPGLRAGSYQLYAGLDGTHAPIIMEVRDTGGVTTVRLPPAGRLEVVVPGARDGLRIDALPCMAAQAPWDGSPPRSTSALIRAGRAVFEGVAPGRYGIVDEHDDRGRHGEGVCDGDANEVSVAADRTATTTFENPASVGVTRTISGIVHGPEGEPRRGVFVELRDREGDDRPLDWTGSHGLRTVTDEAGRFAFPSHESDEYVVRAYAPGLEGRAAVDARERDGVVTMTLR